MILHLRLANHLHAGGFQLPDQCLGAVSSKEVRHTLRHNLAKAVNGSDLLRRSGHNAINISKVGRQQLARLGTDVANAQGKQQPGKVVLFGLLHRG